MGMICFCGAALLSLTFLTGALFAQTPPDNSLSSQGPAASTGQATDTPLPNKVLGQEPLSVKYGANIEVTGILQNLFPPQSPYAGANSLPARRETQVSHSYTLYLWAHPSPRLEVYLNPEIALGNGISAGDGLAAYTNGDLIGQPNYRPDPYLARAFIRWRIPLQGKSARSQKQTAKPANDVIGGNLPAARLVVVAGKFAISDHIDVNTYANNARIQFLNNAFINNLAWDKAGDPRGYNHGAVVSVVEPAYTLRFGSVAMPAVAGGPDLSYNLRSQHSEQVELETHPRFTHGHGSQAAVVRVMAYRNEGTFGSYRDALDAAPGKLPDVTSVRRRGAVKYGFGLNFEQGLADGGASGLFGRVGWNDGRTETFSYSEADRLLSLGGQLSGGHWHRSKDVLGVAVAQSDLSASHKDYLAAGGLGLTLGDGGLSYGPERVAEVYYACQLTPNASLSPDYQCINNPGCNRDRGPATVISLRLHLTF